MENFDAMSISNPYLFSKKQYYNYLIEKQNKKSNSIHLQIHTWYGLKSLKQFMFLGQMFSAIQNRDFFPMSSGDQLREYHHISDDLNFLTYLLNIDASGVIEINHGETVSLKSLAEYVFSYFDLSDLLKIGSLPEPRQDNFQTEFTPSGELGSHNFRKTLPGVIEYFNLLMAGETEIVPPNIADLDNLSE
jgi:nucleoside-diphosphate-sugar epimerase